ncbi:MAG: NUMOD1 domain-containing DNA-binding protein [Dysgonomonas sp.]
MISFRKEGREREVKKLIKGSRVRILDRSREGDKCKGGADDRNKKQVGLGLLERQGEKKDGTKLNHPCRIMKQRLQHSYNCFIKEKSSFLSVCIHVEENKHEFMVSRLVYAAFIKSFDRKNPYLVVRHKDNDCLNNLPENLYLAKKKDVARYILENNRRERNSGCSNPNKWTTEEWRKFHDYKMKPVSQYDQDGNYIRTFKSRIEAAESVGTTPSVICSNTKGKAYCIKNYYWRDGENTAKLSDIKKRKGKPYHPFGHKITVKYNAETGELIKIYSSLTDATKDTDITASTLSCIVKSGKIWDGVLWKYFEKHEDIPNKIIISKNISHRKKYNPRK